MGLAADGQAATPVLHFRRPIPAAPVRTTSTRGSPSPWATPADRARGGTPGCACQHCADLGRFFVEPVRQTWGLRAVEHGLGPVESTIRQTGSDLDRTTLRKVRLYTLASTRSQANCAVRAKQR